MARTKQQAGKSKESIKESGAGKKQTKSVQTQEKADRIRYRCRPKKEEPDKIEISAEQIDPNSPEADTAVMRSLLQMATSGRHITATIFWAKVRCGMQEKGREKERQVSLVPTIVIRTEEGKQA